MRVVALVAAGAAVCLVSLLGAVPLLPLFWPNLVRLPSSSVVALLPLPCAVWLLPLPATVLLLSLPGAVPEL